MSTFNGHDAPPARVMAEIIAVSLELRAACEAPAAAAPYLNRLADDIRRFADKQCGMGAEEATRRRGKFLAAADISPMLRGNFLD